jgi:hypothetical protein
MAKRLEKLPPPPPLWDRLQNGDSHAGRSMRCRKAGLASAKVNGNNGWPNLKKAWEASRKYNLMDQQQRQIEARQLEFQPQREAKREMLRRWGVDPDEPKTYCNVNRSLVRGI